MKTKTVNYQQCIICKHTEPATGSCSNCHEITSLHFFPAESTDRSVAGG